MHLDAGQWFDRYQVIRQLGSGISGTSYEAQDTLLQRRVTLKLIHPWTTLSEAIRRQFFRQLRMLCLLKHTSLASILDYGDVDGQLYLTRHYSPFGSLLSTEGRAWFSPPLPLEHAIRYTIQLAHTIHYLHTNGFLHGALALSNLLVTNNPLEAASPLLLSDTGTAYFVRRYGHPFITLLPITAAPEQFSKRTLPASDQYALASILYYWLAARPPFLGTPEEVERLKLSSSPLLLSTLNSLVTPELAHSVQRALCVPADARYPSLLAFAEALQHAYQPVLYADTNPSFPSLSVSDTTSAPSQPLPTSSSLPNQDLIEAFSTLTNFIEPAQAAQSAQITTTSSTPSLEAMLSSLLPSTSTQEVPDSTPPTPEPSTLPVQPEQAPAPEPTPEPAPEPQPEPIPLPDPLPSPEPDVPQPLPDPTPTPDPLPDVTPEAAPETPPEPTPEIPLPPSPDIAQPVTDPSTTPEMLLDKPLSPSEAIEGDSQASPVNAPLDEDATPPFPNDHPFAHFAHLIITSPYLDSPYEVQLERSEITIGRAGSSDILLDFDPFTSRHHALLQRQEDSYLLSDRRSAYGTLVNGQILPGERPQALKDGDQIGIGQYKLLFRSATSQLPSPAEATQSSSNH